MEAGSGKTDFLQQFNVRHKYISRKDQIKVIFVNLFNYVCRPERWLNG